MAKTMTLGSRTVPGAATLQEAILGGDTDYPTGGYPVSPADVGLTVLRRIMNLRPNNVASAKYTPVAVITSGNGQITALTIALVDSTSGDEVANGTDVSAASFLIQAEGN